MRKLDESKLAKLHNINEKMDKEIGEVGTASRDEFHAKFVSWYYGEILRDRRKELKITQQQLAEKVGKERSYIARIEKGETDMQLSSLVRIARALGIEFTPSLVSPVV